MKYFSIFGGISVLIAAGFIASLTFNPFGFFRSPEHTNNAVAELDFEMVGGRIYVPAEINGHKTSVILDTGAGSSVMDLALANQWALSSSGELNAKGAGSEPVKGKFLSDVKVTFGGITEPILYAIPLEKLNAAEGRRLETIIGSQFFKSHLVEIDYTKHHLRIFDGEAGITPKGTIVPIQFVDSLPHINLEMIIAGAAEYKLEGMVDTGASNTGLTAKFLKAHPLNLSKTEKTVIGGGAGGEIEGRFFRPDTVKIGSVSLAKPVMTLIETIGGLEGEDAKYDVNVGADLLQRFRVTFDYPNKRMFLEPNENVSKPFEADKTGLRIYAEGAELRTLRIVGILPGSSSDSAGIKAGDIIETVDKIPASKFTLQELREMFRSPTAQKWELGIRRGEQQLKVILAAKSII